MTAVYHKLSSEKLIKSQSGYEPVKYNSMEGLYNTGNSCFLNSALQFLYSASAFRQSVLEDQSNEPLISSLRSVFRFMRSPSEEARATIRQNLIKLSQALALEIDNFEVGAQQDSKEVIDNIIELLSKNNSNYRKFFQLRYTSNCPKCDSKMYQNYQSIDINTSMSPLQCATCNSKIRLRFNNSPNYLICLGNKTCIGKDIIYFAFESKAISYKLLSKIIYQGNGSSGHYLCARRQDGKENFTLFNDNYVNRSYQSRQYERITCFLYQKIDGFASSLHLLESNIHGEKSQHFGQKIQWLFKFIWIWIGGLNFKYIFPVLFLAFIGIGYLIFDQMRNQNLIQSPEVSYLEFNLITNANNSRKRYHQVNEDSKLKDLYDKAGLDLFQGVSKEHQQFQLNSNKYYYYQDYQDKSLKLLLKQTAENPTIYQKKINQIVFAKKVPKISSKKNRRMLTEDKQQLNLWRTILLIVQTTTRQYLQ